MTRICIDGRLILPHMTGVGRYLTGLWRGLAAAADDLDFELWLQPGLPAGHPVRQVNAPNFRLVELPVRHMSLSAQARLPLALLRRPPDLYHYPHFDLPWASPGRVVVTIHDLKYIARPDFFPAQRAGKRAAIALLARFACRRARRVICDSAFTARDLEARLGVPPEKLRIAPLGVDPAFFERRSQPALERFRRRAGLAAPYVLFVGERRPHKNLSGLIRAFEYLTRQVEPPLRLVIAGRPYPDYTAPEALVEELGLADRTTFIDYAQEIDLPALYQSAAAFCLPSLYEGFGLPVLEAMASGVPVAASDCAALPEVAGQAASLVPPDDPPQLAAALRSILPGGAQRDRMIAAGLQRAAQFSWERCARLTRQVYLEAIKR